MRDLIERLLLGILVAELGGLNTVISEWLIRQVVRKFLSPDFRWREEELLAELDVQRQKGFKFALPLFAVSAAWGIVVMGLEEARAGRSLPLFLLLTAQRRYLRWKIHVVSARLNRIERVARSKLRLLKYVGGQLSLFGLFIIFWGGAILFFGWLTHQICVAQSGYADASQVVLWFMAYALAAAGFIVFLLRLNAISEAFSVIPDVLWFGKYKRYAERRLLRLTDQLNRSAV